MRALLVDDHAVVRRGVRTLLEESFPGLDVGEAGQPHEAIALVDHEPWDFVLLDLALPGRGGLETLKEIKRARPALPVLVLSMHPEAQYAARALRDGAAGYVTKDSAPETIVAAVRKVLAGGTYVSDALAETLARALRAGEGRPAHERLSDRELEVLRGIAAGKRVKEIAGQLSLSEKTVSTYRARLLEKLDLRTNEQLVQYARREGLAD
jgi:DNA-binding NarL/FixJ family response regulator